MKKPPTFGRRLSQHIGSKGVLCVDGLGRPTTVAHGRAHHAEAHEHHRPSAGLRHCRGDKRQLAAIGTATAREAVHRDAIEHTRDDRNPVCEGNLAETILTQERQLTSPLFFGPF